MTATERPRASTPSSSAAATTASPAPRISPAPGSPSACSSAARVLGGAAVTEEFHPGFRNSTASYTVSLLNPEGDPRPAGSREHGLAIIERPFANFLPLARTAAISRSAADSRPRRPKSRSIRARDAAAAARLLRDARSRRRRAARARARDAAQRRAAAIGALLDAWKVAKRFRALDLAGQRDVLDLFTKSAGDVLDRWFESGADQGGVRLRRRGRQFREPLHARLGLRAAAPRLRRGERQARPVGPRARRAWARSRRRWRRSAPRAASRCAPTPRSRA